MSATPHIASIETALAWLWQTSWQTALLAVAVGIVTWTFRRWISPQARQMLWLLVFLRLVMPALPGSRFSIFGLYSSPKTETVTYQVHSVSTVKNIPFTQMESPAIKPTVIPPSIWSNPQIWLLMVWLTGAGVLFGHAIISTLRFSRKIRRDGGEPDSSTSTIIQECCRHARVSSPKVILTDHVATPALFGVVRPTLLLPYTLAATLDRQCLRSVILHELQHLKRKHLAMDWLLTLIRAVHWFNPAAWLAHRQVRAARELICDQAVIASLADEDAPRNYGLTLLTIAGGTLRKGEPALIAAFAREHKLLRERIETIAGFGKRRYIAGLGLLLALILMAMFLTAPRNEVHAQENKGVVNGPTTTQARQDEQNRAVYEKLNKHLPEVRLDNVALDDAIEFLQDVSGVKISVNWLELEKAGVNRKWTVNVARVADVQFSKLLSISIMNGGSKVKLDYKVIDGGITIVIADEATTKPQAAVVDQDIQIKVDAQILEIPANAAEKNAVFFLDDFGVSLLARIPGVRVIAKPSLLTKNSEEIVFDIGGKEGESVSLRHAATVSGDRKYVTITPSMIYSPNSTISAPEWQRFLAASNRLDELQRAAVAQQNIGNVNERQVQSSQGVEKVIAGYVEELKQKAASRFSAGANPGQTWDISRSTVSVPDGGTLLFKLKRSTYQIQPDKSLAPTEDPPGDKVIVLLLKPTIIIQPDKDRQQFPLLDK